MTLMGKSNPLGSSTCAYPPNTILFDGSNVASTTLTLKRGCYYVRAQGAGAGGGNSGAYGVGGGGGSGAGFDGNIYINNNQENITCYAGIAEQANRKNGEASYIGDLMTFGGGFIGSTDNGKPGNGGTLTISDKINILLFRVKSDGNPGNPTINGSATKAGGNSVITDTGGGIYKGTFEERCATAPGAGGAGGKQWDLNGGYGMYGEVKIQYLKPRP